MRTKREINRALAAMGMPDVAASHAATRVRMTIVIAQCVRNTLEHLHGAGEPFAFITNDEMMRINIAVRYAVFEALELDAEVAGYLLSTFPAYAERPGSPELRAAFERFVTGERPTE
jgi:hypothetical protein